MSCCFGIVPDGANEPAAVFSDLEDAIVWALEKFGAEKFSIRQCAIAEVESGESASWSESLN